MEHGFLGAQVTLENKIKSSGLLRLPENVVPIQYCSQKMHSRNDLNGADRMGWILSWYNSASLRCRHTELYQLFSWPYTFQSYSIRNLFFPGSKLSVFIKLNKRHVSHLNER